MIAMQETKPKVYFPEIESFTEIIGKYKCITLTTILRKQDSNGIWREAIMMRATRTHTELEDVNFEEHIAKMYQNIIHDTYNFLILEEVSDQQIKLSDGFTISYLISDTQLSEKERLNETNMKAKTILLTNGTEIDQASKLGLEIPELKYRDADFYFDITKVTLFFINDDEEINISIDGDMWTLYHTEELWRALKAQINPAA